MLRGYGGVRFGKVYCSIDLLSTNGSVMSSYLLFRCGSNFPATYYDALPTKTRKPLSLIQVSMLP